MGSAVLTLGGTVVGIPTGQQNVNVLWNLPNAVGETQPVTLGVGDNAIPVPVGAATMLVVPPDGNLVVISMKDVSGETGVALHPQVPCFRSLAPTVTVVYLSVPALLDLPVSIAFW